MRWDGQIDRLTPIEPVLIADCFVTGITAITYMGGLVRATLHCDRPTENGEIDRIIVARLIMSEADFATMAGVGFETAQSHQSFPMTLEMRAGHH